MTRLPILPPVLVAVMLLAAAGCAYAQNIDCRSCHATGTDPGTGDFSAIYANVSAHHPVGINYPLASEFFNQPNGQSADITFFDRNGNSQPDSDEIQLFVMHGTLTITCATCHREHGTTLLPANAPRDMYLRVNNIGSALCTTCHSQ